MMLSSIGASSRFQLACALYLVTAQVYQEARHGKRVTSDGDGTFATYFKGTSGLLFQVLWLCPCLPDYELTFLASIEDGTPEYFDEVRRLSEVLEQDTLKAELETMDSFVAFLRTLNSAEAEYWPQVYERIRVDPLGSSALRQDAQAKQTQSLLQEWLNETCTHCGLLAGDRHTMYPKTSGVRAGDAFSAEYRRKTKSEYGPGREELSTHFWHCKQCAKALGPDYQGAPDENGNCHACAERARKWETHKASVIEAAGSLKSWERIKLLNKILTPVDYVAVMISIISASIALLFVVSNGLFGLWKELGLMWSHKDDQILLITVGLAFGWCAVRWKHLNAKPTDF
jgi:hypothetical protein